MKKARFMVFGLFLAGAVALAVGTLWAQGPFDDAQGQPAPAPAPRPDPRGRMMLLDGRGSQLGVTVNDADNGVRIEDVDQDSAASKAGLKAGDVVTEFDGEKVRSARQFSRLVEETPGGRLVKLGILRDGKRQTIDVTPENRAFSWGFDGDRIGRDIARGMRDLEPRLREIEPRLREIEPRLRELEPRLREMEPRLREIEPRLREFRFDGPAFNFDFDNMMPVSPRTRLGVQIESLSPQLAQYFGVKDGGVLVSSVTTGSAAEKAGLKAGDVITSINGDRVRDYDDLVGELRDKTGEVTIGVTRDKKETTVKATIEAPEVRTRRPAL
jgi:serine protease Do